MKVDQAWLDFLRGQFPLGSQVRTWKLDEPQNISFGTLEQIDEEGRFHTRMEDGSIRKLALGEEQFSIHPPEPTLLKLYMPLTADFYPRDEWGNTAETSEEWDGQTLLDYEVQVLGALVKNRMLEEAERGLMHWYGKQDSLDAKVRSVMFSAEVKNGQLWGVAECQVVGKLTPTELGQLKDYISGQASDGWGESFEQKEVEVDGGELYVHLWSSDGWSIQTEQERFAPKVAKGLPELCFSTLPSTGQLICIKRGESDWKQGAERGAGGQAEQGPGRHPCPAAGHGDREHGGLGCAGGRPRQLWTPQGGAAGRRDDLWIRYSQWRCPHRTETTAWPWTFRQSRILFWTPGSGCGPRRMPG